MQHRRSRHPLINELNEHKLNHRSHFHEMRTAEERYAVERALSVAQGVTWAYLVHELEDGEQSVPRDSRGVSQA